MPFLSLTISVYFLSRALSEGYICDVGPPTLVGAGPIRSPSLFISQRQLRSDLELGVPSR